MAYERLLRSRGLHLYRSVAVIRSAHYWQDEPGRQSMAVNFAAHKERFLNIERIAIVADSLWPATERFPIEPLHSWLAEQHTHGLSVRLVRLSELEREPDLVLDLGIYGTRARRRPRARRPGPNRAVYAFIRLRRGLGRRAAVGAAFAPSHFF